MLPVGTQALEGRATGSLPSAVLWYLQSYVLSTVGQVPCPHVNTSGVCGDRERANNSLPLCGSCPHQVQVPEVQTLLSPDVT